jgi:hypothetical protein
MAAFNFPNSPSTNDTYTANGVTFKWNGTIWQRISASTGAQGSTGPSGPTGAQGAAAGLTISTSAPGSPSAGDMWWDSDSGLFLTYYNDGNSSQWVELNQGPKGAQGATGAQGAAGAQGATGPTGAQGAAGAQGATGAAGSNASISSNADNRVITGGSGTNLVAESGLTYDGTILNISNDIPQLYLTDTNSNNSYGRVRGNGGNLVLSADVNNASGTSVVLFEIDGSEKSRIDNYGTLRIGNLVTTEVTSSNTKRIALGAKASIWGWTSGNINGALTLADNYYWDGANNKAIENDHSAYLTLRSGNLRFGTTSTTHSAGGNISGGIHERFRVETNGNVTINDGNLVIGTSGHGIDFGATYDGSNVTGVSASSELLSDYEEGTFQPILKRLMTNGVTETNFYTQSVRQGNYTRIGDRVWITGRIHWSGGSTGSGSVILTNLPFTINTGGANEIPIVVGYRSGWNYTNITGYGRQNYNRFYIQYFDNNGSYDISPSATASSGTFYFSANYELV